MRRYIFILTLLFIAFMASPASSEIYKPSQWNSSGTTLSYDGDVTITGALSTGGYSFSGTGERISGVSGRIDLNDITGLVSIEPGITTTGDLNVEGGVYFGSMHFMKSTDTLSTQMAATASGGSLYLAPWATYSISAAITRSTPIRIIGNNATITSSLSSGNYPLTFTDHVYMSDLTFNFTIGNSWAAGVYVNGTGGTVLPQSVFENIKMDAKITGTTGSNEFRGFLIIDANALFVKPQFRVENNSSTTGAQQQTFTAIKHQGNSTQEATTKVIIVDADIYIYGYTSGAAAIGISNSDNSATTNVETYVFGSNIDIIYLGGVSGKQFDGIQTGGADSKVFDVGSFINGYRYDVYSSATGRFIPRGTVLGNNTCANCWSVGAWQDTNDWEYSYNGIFKGNVGIGTGTANAALVVGSGGTMDNPEGAGDVYIVDELEVDGNTFLGNNVADRLIITGNVGIGSSAPGGPLIVTGTSGWTVKTGANTACNTTCGATASCAFGIDDTAKVPIACTSNTADTCVCMGP